MIVIAPPTEMLLTDDVTMYLVGGPATVRTGSELPVSDELSVAMMTYEVADVVPVVNEIAATPFASVVEFAAAKDPPVPVFDQVTVRPAVFTAFPFMSVSCAEAVIAAPATGPAGLTETTYFAGGPSVVVTAGEVPVTLLSSCTDAVKLSPTVFDVVTVNVTDPAADVVPLPVEGVAVPPLSVQVTSRPDVASLAPLAVSCAVKVTGDPAIGPVELAVTA